MHEALHRLQERAARHPAAGRLALRAAHCAARVGPFGNLTLTALRSGRRGEPLATLRARRRARWRDEQSANVYTWLRLAPDADPMRQGLEPMTTKSCARTSEMAFGSQLQQSNSLKKNWAVV